MKHISYEQFCKIKSAFSMYVDEREDRYAYLFLVINGFPFKTPRSRHEKKYEGKLLSLISIRTLLESEDTRDSLVELAVLCHYRGSIVEVRPGTSRVVLRDDLVYFAGILADKYKELKAYGDAPDD